MTRPASDPLILERADRTMAASRVPSIATLRAIPWLSKVGDPDTLALAVRKVLLRAVRDTENRRTGDGKIRVGAAIDALREVSKILDCFGVENLEGRHYYVNTGDTYTPTVTFCEETRAFRVTSWGDIVEAEERDGRHRYA